jgi:hypothetical protein
MAFQRHQDADRRIQSARYLIRILLEAEELYPTHRKEFIKLALWKVTEAEGGKYNLRYQSRGALHQGGATIQHDHVYERAKMADALIADPERMDEILSLAVGCAVTREEHQRLTEIGKQFPNVEGWERYKRAGVTVIDTLTGAELRYESELQSNASRAEPRRLSQTNAVEMKSASKSSFAMTETGKGRRFQDKVFASMAEWAKRQPGSDLSLRRRQDAPVVIYCRGKKVIELQPVKRGISAYLVAPSDREVNLILSRLSNRDLRQFPNPVGGLPYIRFTVMTDHDIDVVKELVCERLTSSAW